MRKRDTTRRRAKSPEHKVRTPGENLKHVIKTGLPPGIEPEQFWDPGSQVPTKPVKNRS